MDLRVLHQPVWADHARREDGAGRLGGAIACAYDGEDDGDGAAQGSEEGLRERLVLKARYEAKRDGRHRLGWEVLVNY
jgi:hypothetical protein